MGLVHLGGIPFSKSGIILAVCGQKRKARYADRQHLSWGLAGRGRSGLTLSHTLRRERRHSRGPCLYSRRHGPDHPSLSSLQEAEGRGT